MIAHCTIKIALIVSEFITNDSIPKISKFSEEKNLGKLRQKLSQKCTYIYRVIQVKVDETKQLFPIENMDKFLIKWYFDYCKGGKFYMVPKKFRKKNLTRHSKSLSKPDFLFLNYCILLVLYTVCYNFDRDFECLARFFSEFFWYHIKFPTFVIIKIPFDLKSIPVFCLK